MRRALLAVMMTLCGGVGVGQPTQKPTVPTELEPLVREVLRQTHASERVAASLQSILSFENFQSPPGIPAEKATFDTDMTEALNRAAKQQGDRYRELGKRVLEGANLDDAAWYVYAPLYNEGWTPDDLKGLIAFYSTPLGQKVITRDSQFHLWEQIRTMEFFGEKISDTRKAARRQELLKTNPARVTADDMHLFGTLVEQYAFEHDENYPSETEPTKLQKLVGPPDFGVVDAWGTPFRFVFSTDHKHYRVISAGADKKFGEYTKAWGAKPESRSEPGVDIVLEDGVFVQYPPGATDQRM
jgi:hypothetical protein